MAEIPRYFARPRVPSLNLQGEGAGFGAISQGLGQVARTFERIQAVEEARQLAELTTQANKALLDARLELSERIANAPERDEEGGIIFRDSAEQVITDVDRRYKRLVRDWRKLNPELAAKVSAKFDELFGETRLKVSQHHRLISIQQRAADIVTSVDTLAKVAGEENDERSREFAYSMIADGEATGVLSAKTANELRARLDATVSQLRIANIDGKLPGRLDDRINSAARVRARDELAQLEREGLIDIEASYRGLDVKPAAIEQQRRAYVDSLHAAYLRGKIDQAPGVVSKELKSGAFDQKLSERTIRALLAEDQHAVAQLEAKRKAEQRERHSRVKDLLDDYASTVGAGLQWAGPTGELQRAVSEFPDLLARFNRVNAASAIRTQAKAADPISLQNYINELRQKPTTKEGAELIKQLESDLGHMRTALERDALSYGARALNIQLPPLDLNNPGSLHARSQAAGVIEQRYGVPTSPLTDDESKAFVRELSTLPADARVQRMRAMAQSFTPRQTQMIAAQIDKAGAGVLAQAFGMSAQVPEAASRIVAGMDIRKQQPLTLPQKASARSMDEAINRGLAEAYRADPRALEAAREAIKAVYAWASWQVNDFSGSLNTTRLQNSIRTVTGGLVDFNGTPTLPPRYGATEKDLRSMIERADFSNAAGRGIDAKAVLDYGKLTAVGPGLYAVHIGGAPVFDKSGKPFILDLMR